MIATGTKVRVKATARGSDAKYAGRKGIVVPFDPALPWTGPRALLAAEQFVCVHFYPVSERQRKRGSPMALLSDTSLVELPA